MMKDQQSQNANGSSELARQLRQLRFIRQLYLRVGQTATRAIIKTQTILNKEVSLPGVPSRFIQSLIRDDRLGPAKALAREKLEHVVEQSNEVLASATTVFPLTLFPDSIILDRTKLTITRRNFFFSSDVMSIRIEDILNVSATVGPLFGSLTIATRVMSSDDHFTISHFKREDVIHMKHMIQGYVIARHNNIACDHLHLDELVATLRDLGRDTNKEHHELKSAIAQRLI